MPSALFLILNLEPYLEPTSENLESRPIPSPLVSPGGEGLGSHWRAQKSLYITDIINLLGLGLANMHYRSHLHQGGV